MSLSGEFYQMAASLATVGTFFVALMAYLKARDYFVEPVVHLAEKDGENPFERSLVISNQSGKNWRILSVESLDIQIEAKYDAFEVFSEKSKLENKGSFLVKFRQKEQSKEMKNLVSFKFKLIYIDGFGVRRERIYKVGEYYQSVKDVSSWRMKISSRI